MRRARAESITAVSCPRRLDQSINTCPLSGSPLHRVSHAANARDGVVAGSTMRQAEKPQPRDDRPKTFSASGRTNLLLRIHILIAAGTYHTVYSSELDNGA